MDARARKFAPRRFWGVRMYIVWRGPSAGTSWCRKTSMKSLFRGSGLMCASTRLPRVVGVVLAPDPPGAHDAHPFCPHETLLVLTPPNVNVEPNVSWPMPSNSEQPTECCPSSAENDSPQPAEVVLEGVANLFLKRVAKVLFYSEAQKTRPLRGSRPYP